MVCTTGRQSCSGPIEDPPNFVEPQQIAIKGKRLLQIFHIEDDMAEVVRFHILIPREIPHGTRESCSETKDRKTISDYFTYHMSLLRTCIVIKPFVHNLAILPPGHRNLFHMNRLPVGRDEIHRALVL
jgi:hypothetical protein